MRLEKLLAELKEVGGHRVFGVYRAWVGVVEMPAGMQTDFLERLNAKTKGNVETKILKADQRI